MKHSTYTISPLPSKDPARAERGQVDWLLKIHSLSNSFTWQIRVERYIDALRVVRMLQLHLKESDKSKAA